MSTATAPESDEDIQRLLAAESVCGPRTFRGRQLAALTRGLRDLRNKVVAPNDTGVFYEIALLYILAEAFSDDAAERLIKRRGLLVATDDVTGFRLIVNLFLDDLTDAELVEAGKLVDEIEGVIAKAEVKLAEKKSIADGAEPSLMKTPLPSGVSPASPDGGPTTSGGK